jgi:hypothetical protein
MRLGSTYALILDERALRLGVVAKNQPSQHMCIEMIGAGFGGYAAGILPDWLGPAICSWHRGICHSTTAGAAVL